MECTGFIKWNRTWQQSFKGAWEIKLFKYSYVGCCSSNIDCYHMLIRASILKFCHILSSGIAELDFSVNHSFFTILNHSVCICLDIYGRMYKNQIHNETNTDMYYIKIIEELCWAKHLPLNTLCAYLDYMTFWLTTEKDIKKRLYVNYSKIINNKNLGPSGPWAKYSDNTGQNVDLIKRQYFSFR